MEQAPATPPLLERSEFNLLGMLESLSKDQLIEVIVKVNERFPTVASEFETQVLEVIECFCHVC